MGEVKTETSRIHVGTGLLHMIAKHHAQGFLEQMGGAVILAGQLAVLGAQTFKFTFSPTRSMPLVITPTWPILLP